MACIRKYTIAAMAAGNFTAEAASADLEIALAEAVGAPNFATAHRILRDTQAFVRATFEELFDRPAAGA